MPERKNEKLEKMAEAAKAAEAKRKREEKLKKNAAEASMSLKGKSLCFLGRLQTPLAKAKADAKKAGAIVDGYLTALTDVVVMGPRAGPKLKQSVPRGVAVWTEEEFMAFLGSGKLPRPLEKRVTKSVRRRDLEDFSRNVRGRLNTETERTGQSIRLASKEGTAAAAAAAGSLETTEVYEMMKGTRVLFSFGCARGGLKFAQHLRVEIMRELSWPHESIYIDVENLKDHRKTTFVADGTPRNPHWAEFYYMGALVTHSVIVVLDTAWLKSRYCRGELALFIRNLSNVGGKQPNGFPGSEFQLFVLYDSSSTTLQSAKNEVATWRVPPTAPQTKFLEVCLTDARNSVANAKTLHTLAEDVKQRSESEETRIPEIDREGYSALYDTHWQALAINQQETNQELWWWGEETLVNGRDRGDTERHDGTKGAKVSKVKQCDVSKLTKAATQKYLHAAKLKTLGGHNLLLSKLYGAVKNNAITAGNMAALVKELGGAPANDPNQNKAKVMKAFKDAL